MAKAVLTISSKNYGAWALRGWLMAKLAKLEFTEHIISPDDPAMKAEMLLLSASMRVPSLDHDGVHVWDTLAIGEYLNEIKPKAGLLPADRAARAHCRAICGEMHSGFSAMRSSLPMNIKAHFPGFKLWSRAQTDIDRIEIIWQECLAKYGGPFLFGAKPCIADAMFAPVVTRFITYSIPLPRFAVPYCQAVISHPCMQEWIGGAQAEDWVIEKFEGAVEG